MSVGGQLPTNLNSASGYCASTGFRMCFITVSTTSRFVWILKLPQNRMVLRALCGGGYQGLNCFSSNPCGITSILSREIQPAYTSASAGAMAITHRALFTAILSAAYMYIAIGKRRGSTHALPRFARYSMLCEL